MRVKRGMRGLIVDEGHLSSLLINDGKSMGALGGLFVDDGRQFQGLPSTGLPMVACSGSTSGVSSEPSSDSVLRPESCTASPRTRVSARESQARDARVDHRRGAPERTRVR